MLPSFTKASAVSLMKLITTKYLLAINGKVFNQRNNLYVYDTLIRVAKRKAVKKF